MFEVSENADAVARTCLLILKMLIFIFILGALWARRPVSESKDEEKPDS